ncbi:hypothetical protein ACFQX6_51940 [Streptosporangium lutulentum]
MSTALPLSRRIAIAFTVSALMLGGSPVAAASKPPSPHRTRHRATFGDPALSCR